MGMEKFGQGIKSGIHTDSLMLGSRVIFLKICKFATLATTRLVVTRIIFFLELALIIIGIQQRREDV